MSVAVDPEGVAPISTLWTPHNGKVCYPAVEAAQELGNSLAYQVMLLWDRKEDG